MPLPLSMAKVQLSEWLKIENGKCLALFVPPDDIKAVVRSLYYLHTNTDDDHRCHNCPSKFHFLIPNTYFSSVRPIKFELRYKAAGIKPRYEEEPISSLANLFYPYRLSYRYYNDNEGSSNFLTALATEHNPAWVNGNQVYVNLPLVGIEVERGILPQQVPVQALKTDDGGRQIVKLCTGCFQVHSIVKVSACCQGNTLLPVKIWAAPRTEGGFYPAPDMSAKIANQFCAARGKGATTVLGSEVSAARFRHDNEQGWLPMPQTEPIEFTAHYRKPLKFSIEGRGSSWVLPDAAMALLKQPKFLEKFTDQNPATPDRLRLTAAALYKRVIANVAGVHHDTLQSAVMDDGRIWVWEIFEGGAGIIEIFADTLRDDPLRVYREFIRTVACPIHLAEQAFFESVPFEHLKTAVQARLHLSQDDEVLESILEDARAELQRITQQSASGEHPEATCTANDGCPVCLHDEYLSREVHLRPSRQLASALVQQFVQVLDRTSFTTHMEAAQAMNVPGALPRLLQTADDQFYVLVF